ncbi:MAG: response regulator transcription factor [Planctomycetota bacterium]|nr:response regulator transcription factor [Planctomycetota bacterium]
MNKVFPGVKKVVLVDDHPLFRRGLAQVINQEKDLRIVGEADDAAGGLALLESAKPDVIIVDITLPDRNGIELVKDIHVRAPETLVLVLSMHEEGIYAERVLRAGARGYVCKAENPARVIEAIRAMLEGGIFVSDKMSAQMLQKFVGIRGRSEQPGVDNLSDRELQVLEMVGSGMPTREIAQALHVSVKTVDAHREHIKRKLNLENAAELRKYAIAWSQTRVSP